MKRVQIHFNPVEFDGFRNCGELAVIKVQAQNGVGGFYFLEFDGIKNRTAIA